MTDKETPALTIMWRVDSDATEPIKTSAKVPAWPHHDSDGKTIFVNTHFEDQRKAWEQLMAEHDAHLSFRAQDVRQARENVTKSEAALIDVTLKVEEARSKFRAWQRSPAGS